jgi:hypothetical protein
MERPKVKAFTPPKKMEEYPLGPAYTAGNLVDSLS